MLIYLIYAMVVMIAAKHNIVREQLVTMYVIAGGAIWLIETILERMKSNDRDDSRAD